jgi:hypothetical protein
MKLLFNLEVVEGNRVTARPSDYLKSLSHSEQVSAVTEFLHWAEREARDNTDPQARAEAGIGVATAKEYLDKLEQSAARIYTGANTRKPHDQED